MSGPNPAGTAALATPAGEGAKDRALEAVASARESMSKGTRAISDYIGKQPARALGIALGLGVLLGWVIKRR